MMERFSQSTASREEGQTMAEYAVILGVITVLVVVALTALSNQISTVIGQVTGII
jgi:Flp pilus assembly pilin Flp